eukprot:362900-Rhodomonas_salina.2
MRQYPASFSARREAPGLIGLHPPQRVHLDRKLEEEETQRRVKKKKVVGERARDGERGEKTEKRSIQHDWSARLFV